MPLYLAIDAGGTKTECLLADDTRVLARASTGTVKLMRVSEPEASTRLHSMIQQAASTAGISVSQITRTCFGLAGITSPSVHAWATRALSAIVPGDLILCGDVDIALDAAFSGGPGILVIAGTGSNAIGRSPTGELHGAGGWGQVIGDEGSGYWIGLEAIRAALRAQDRLGLGGPPSTCLLREIERHWNLASTGDLVALANQRNHSATSPPPDFAALAPVVARCADRGDSLAAGILERAGEELADLVTLIFHKMTIAPSIATATTPGAPSIAASSRWVGSQTAEISQSQPAAESIPVAFTGSVLSQIAPVRTAMVDRLAHSLPNAQVRNSAVDPLEGALWRARQA
jgi:glucosamine kinase